jgi:hypothetical protein
MTAVTGRTIGRRTAGTALTAGTTGKRAAEVAASTVSA